MNNGMPTDRRVPLTRRDFLKWTVVLAGASLLAACQQKEKATMPPTEQWAFCLHDFQLEGVFEHDHTYRNFPRPRAVPETVTTFRKEKFVPLNEDWQWFWFRNLIYCAFGHFDETKLNSEETQAMHKAWLWLIKGTEVVTNRHGPETHWEVITGESENVGLDFIAHDGLLAGGNFIKITGEKVRKGGQIMYPFETLDGSKPPPDIQEVNVQTRPDLLHRATICHFKQLSNGTFQVDPFPQLEPFNAHTVFLNISTAQNFVPVNRVRLLDSFQAQNPYNPAVEMNFAK